MPRREPLRALLPPREQAHANHHHDKRADEEVRARQAGELVEEQAAEHDVGRDDHHRVERDRERRLPRAERPVEQPQLRWSGGDQHAEREPGDLQVGEYADMRARKRYSAAQSTA